MRAGAIRVWFAAVRIACKIRIKLVNHGMTVPCVIMLIRIVNDDTKNQVLSRITIDLLFSTHHEVAVVGLVRFMMVVIVMNKN